MAAFFIVISPMMLHNLIGLLRLYTATLSSVLSVSGIFPGMHKIAKAEVFNDSIIYTKKHARSSVNFVTKEKKKKSLSFNCTQYLLIGVF